MARWTSSNAPPVAEADAYSAPQDTSLDVPAELGVLANDSDPDGDPLTAALDAALAHGVLELSADGSFRYAPAADFAGLDTFTYHANDGADDSRIATVCIEVGGPRIFLPLVLLDD